MDIQGFFLYYLPANIAVMINDYMALYSSDSISWINFQGVLHRKSGYALDVKGGWVLLRNGKLKLHAGEKGAHVMTRGKYWYINGKLHRKNGPSIIYDDRQEWYENGKLHRINGPAIITYPYNLELAGVTFQLREVKHWYYKGLRHRNDGPSSNFIGGDEYRLYDIQFPNNGIGNIAYFVCNIITKYLHYYLA